MWPRCWATQAAAGTAAALVMVSSAYPQGRWHTVAAPQDRVIALDTRTIERTPEGHLLAWLRHDFNTMQAKPSGLRYRKMLALMVVDCTRNRERRLQAVYYDDAGVIVSRSNRPGRWATVRRDPVALRTITETCQYASARVHRDVRRRRRPDQQPGERCPGLLDAVSAGQYRAHRGRLVRRFPRAAGVRRPGISGRQALFAPQTWIRYRSTDVRLRSEALWNIANQRRTQEQAGTQAT
jgi:hypothetical protein